MQGQSWEHEIIGTLSATAALSPGTRYLGLILCVIPSSVLAQSVEVGTVGRSTRWPWEVGGRSVSSVALLQRLCLEEGPSVPSQPRAAHLEGPISLLPGHEQLS